MKTLSFIKKSDGSHWVGDGFPVRNIFSYNDLAPELSPFLLLDYAGPASFPSTQNKRGVGEHPHRGFETVTIVYDGEVEHRDSGGGGGKIGPGEVQWMTAAAGVVHEEFHGTEYAKSGGPFEVVQLWVDLPRKDKLGKPGYQSLTREAIPRVSTDGVSVRVIAGEYEGQKGPARTFSPMNVWDIRLQAGRDLELMVPAGWTTAFFVLKGRIRAGEQTAGEAELAVFEREGETLRVEASEDSVLLFLNGKPLEQPVVGYGPFVMTSEAEIRQAFRDYQSGRMGKLR